MIRQSVFFLFLFSMFWQCSFYNEATDKKKEQQEKDQITALMELQSQYKSYTEFQEKLGILELFASGGAIPEVCTPPENDPDWLIPGECTVYLPAECEGATTAQDLEDCGGYSTGGYLSGGLPAGCEYDDPGETIPDDCYQYIATECQDSTTWSEANQCVAELTGDLPDTSDEPNPIDDYPGETPSETGHETGTCYFDTDSALTGSRDWCCFSATASECSAMWQFYDSSGETFTPTFQVDASSSEHSCLDQGFVYCDGGIQCCYN